MGRLIKQIFALFSLIYMTGALVFVLTPNGSSESPLIQLIGILIGSVSACSLLLMRGPVRIPLQRYVPVTVVLAYALLSTVWSVDFQISVRRTGALILTAIFAIWLVESFRPRAVMNLLLAALLVVCLASYVAIFAFPDFGVHQDMEKTYVGSWRGLFMHKNDLGITVSLAVVAFVVAFLLRRGQRWFYTLCIIQAVVLVIGSQSSQAIVLALLCSGTAVLAVFLRQRTAAERAMVLLFLIPFSVVINAVSEYATTQVLLALGKDATLSARTEIWEVVLSGLKGRLFLGGGYGAGWELVNDAVLQRFGREIGHAHNGFIQLTVDIGIVGTLLFTSVFIYTGILAFVQNIRERQMEFACFWLTYQVFFLVGNMANSFALEYNSISMVLFTIAPRLLLTPRLSRRRTPAASALSDRMRTAL